MPRSAAAAWLTDPERHDRLRAVLTLPAGSFKEEGTDVAVDLVIFGMEREARAPLEMKLSTLDEALPDFDLACHNTFEVVPRPLSPTTIAANAPSITLPITGDTRVRVAHDGRRITLKYFDALTQAKVHNGLLNRPVHPPEERHRYPKGIEFHGQGQFDIELWLLQDDPAGCLRTLQKRIHELGGTPVVDEGLAPLSGQAHPPVRTARARRTGMWFVVRPSPARSAAP